MVKVTGVHPFLADVLYPTNVPRFAVAVHEIRWMPKTMDAVKRFRFINVSSTFVDVGAFLWIAVNEKNGATDGDHTYCIRY